MSLKFLTLLLVPLVMALASSAFAEPGIRFRVLEVDEQQGAMTMTVEMIDPSGRQSTLGARDFDVYLDAHRLNVTGVQQVYTDRQPAYVVVLADVSGSMWGEPVVQTRAAIREFISHLEMGDRVALMVFSTDIRLIQDFTSDRAVLHQAVDQLVAFGDTALYDAVIAGVELASAMPEASRLLILLSDGVATAGFENRDRSLAIQQEADVRVSVVGLGNELDVPYLRALTEAGDGIYAEAPTPDMLRQAYRAMTASVSRPFTARYTLNVEVPGFLDRTTDAMVEVRARVRTESVTAWIGLGPLSGGALMPPFQIQIEGLPDGQSLAAPATLRAVASDGRDLVNVQFTLNDEPLRPMEGSPLLVRIDPESLGKGSYTLRVRAEDVSGRAAEASARFAVLAPAAVVVPAGGGFPVMPLLVLLGVAVVGVMAYQVVRMRPERAPKYVTAKTVKPPVLATRESQGRRQTASESGSAAAMTPGRPLGRLVVMNEDALRTGDIDSIRQFELGVAPLVIGTGSGVDVRLDDETGLIAAEEARVWVQRGRLAYHKLTTLSAMATEGVTSSWVFLESGDEMRLGPYRILFQQYNEDEAPSPSLSSELEAATSRLPWEHGMSLQRAPMVSDEDGLPQT